MKKRLFISFCFMILLYPFVSSSQSFRVTEKAIYTWDDAANDWVQTIVENYTYGNDGLKETQIDGFLYPSMIPAYRNTKAYNANNDITENLRETYIDVSKTWQPFLLMTHTYDGTRETEVVTKSYDFLTTMLQNSYRNLTEYKDGRPVRQTEQVWNSTSNVWVNEEEILATYSNDLLTKVEYNVWNAATETWEADEREERMYNAQGQVSFSQNEFYDMGVWKDLDRTTYTYTNGLETSIVFEEWNGAGWVNSDRLLSTYDADGNRSILINEEWDVSTNAWKGVYREENQHQEARGGLSDLDLEAFSFKVYPNPTSDFINVQSDLNIDKIELFEITGRKVLALKNTKQLNIKQQASGLYLIKIKSENRSFSSRIVIQK